MPVRHARRGEAISPCTSLAKLLPAVSHETRVELLFELAVKPACGQALAERLELDHSAISDHLGRLLERGLVCFDQHGKRRIYRLTSSVSSSVHDSGVQLHLQAVDGAEITIRRSDAAMKHSRWP